jgi:hypothetical protein
MLPTSFRCGCAVEDRDEVPIRREQETGEVWLGFRRVG